MYKRKPRILFLASHPGPALLVSYLAQQEAAEWLDHRAGFLSGHDWPWWQQTLQELRLPLPAQPLASIALDWPDLLISLDPGAARQAARLHTLHKHWPLDAKAGLCRQARRRLKGMIGGLRLMSR